MEKKRILILRACGIDNEKQECDSIKTQCELYNIEVHDYCPKTNVELEGILRKGVAYDYFYLSSHGDADGFANQEQTIDFSWFNFGVLLCDSMCMKPECIIMLSCCRGGLNQVAIDLFYCCPKIAFIVGPRQSLFPHDMLIGFSILLYNLEHRNVDPIVAAEKVKLGTDIRFICFDRLEAEADTAYLLRVGAYEQRAKEMLNKAREKANEPIINIENT